MTLAFAEVFRIIANAAAITGGAAGTLIRLDVRPENFQFASRAVFYWIVLALVVGALILTRIIERNRFGAWLVAIRENEDAARALGVNTLAVKLQAIGLSAAITAAAGAFYAQYFLLGLAEVTRLVAGRIPGIDLALYGTLLVLVIAFAPQGIQGLVRRLGAGLGMARR